MTAEQAKPKVKRHAQFMRRKAVADELGVTRHTLRRIVATDTRFPRFFEIAPGIQVIERRDLDRWIRLKKLLAARADYQT